MKCLLCCFIRGIKVWLLQKISDGNVKSHKRKHLIVLMIMCIIDDKKKSCTFYKTYQKDNIHKWFSFKSIINILSIFTAKNWIAWFFEVYFSVIVLVPVAGEDVFIPIRPEPGFHAFTILHQIWQMFWKW